LQLKKSNFADETKMTKNNTQRNDYSEPACSADRFHVSPKINIDLDK